MGSQLLDPSTPPAVQLNEHHPSIAEENITMPECHNCGRHISIEYRRVFAGADGTVHGCPVCTPSPLTEAA